MRVSVLAVLAATGALLGGWQQPDPVAARVETIARFSFRVTGVGVSPSGRLFYLPAESLMVYDLDRRTTVVVTPIKYAQVIVSPTGSSVALIRHDDRAGNGGLWSMSVSPSTGLSTGAPKQLTWLPPTTVCHSPDGKTLAFIGGRRIAVMSVEGGTDRTVATGNFDASLSWSPDGKWIYAEEIEPQTSPGGGAIRTAVRISAGGGPPEAMSPRVSRATPGLSPGGRFLVVQPYAPQPLPAAQRPPVVMRAPAEVAPGSSITLADGGVVTVGSDRTLHVPVGGGNLAALRSAGYTQLYAALYAVYDTARRLVSSVSLTLPATPIDFAWTSSGLHLAMILPDTVTGWTRLVDVDLGTGLHAAPSQPR